MLVAQLNEHSGRRALSFRRDMLSAAAGVSRVFGSSKPPVGAAISFSGHRQGMFLLTVPLLNSDRLRSWKLHLIRKLLESMSCWLAILLAGAASVLKTRAALQLENIAPAPNRRSGTLREETPLVVRS